VWRRVRLSGLGAVCLALGCQAAGAAADWAAARWALLVGGPGLAVEAGGTA
jgi:hypothetical protein